MALINSNSFLNSFNLFKRGNDPYVVTPQINFNQLLDFLEKQDQEISIDGNESDLLRTTPQLFAVIYKHANMLANGRFVHLDKNNEEIEDSDFVKLLNRPNAFQAGNEWLIQQDVQKLTYGNSFIYLLKGSQLKEVPDALWNLAPKKVTIKRTGKIWNQTEEAKIVSEYLVNANGIDSQAMHLKTIEVLHRNIQDVDDPIVGSSPFHALKMPISNIRSAYGFRNVIMTKKGAIGMITNNSKGTAGSLPFTKDEREKVERQFNSDYGITEEQKKIILSAANLKWNPMSYPTKDLLLFEEVDANFETIIDAYGMDKSLFSSDATFENKIMGERSVYQNTIIPEADDLANGLTNKFKLNEKGEKIILDYSHVASLQEDQQRTATVIKTKAEAISTLQASGLYTSEQIQDIVGF